MKPLFLALKVQLNDYKKLQSDFFGVINGRWIPSENIHITISYFGDKFTVEELLEKLPPLITSIEPFTLSGLGYFKANKILYAKSETSELGVLNTSIANTFSLNQTKSFIPHATLMRVKTVENEIAFEKILTTYENKEIARTDTSLELMRSHIKHPGGASYECLKRFELL